MKRGNSLPSKRARPRRNEGRVSHIRTKPKAGAGPSALEREFMGWVVAKGCLVCGKPATFHHVTGYADRPGRIARDHRRGVPLCPPHHQKVRDPLASDPVSVEGLGHQGFYRRHGIDLFTVGGQLWDDFQCELT